MHDTIPPRRRRRSIGALSAIAIVLVVVVGLRAWTVPYYALTPGQATRVSSLVTIRGLRTNPHHDPIMLTDVYLQSLSAWQWLIMHFESHVQFVSASELVEPGVPSSELINQGYLEMSDSKTAAQVAALRALGWTIPSESVGATVTGVVDPSPAYQAGLGVADRVVGVGGTPVRSACGLIGAVHLLAPGSRVRLDVRRARVSASGVITYAPARVLSVRTATPPSAITPSGCPGVRGRDHSWLGISLENAVHYRLPGSIAINTANIGGPSAGLAMTLTLINELSAGSLTGHQVVAATGTIDPQGQVGDVGGVAEKTVAVQRAGATLFIVPSVEVATARAAATPRLRVVGVTTLGQALAALRHVGGQRPVSLTPPR